MYIHKKIAITGGPCAGKTTAMQKIVEEFTERGYKVFVISETATDLITSGAKPFGDNPVELVEFQRCVLNLQLSKERIFEEIAKQCDQDTIILCDRGVMDNRAYINNEIFRKLLKEKDLNEMELLSSYDLVIHLVTAADGAEENYTLANNQARTETKEEAIKIDRKTLNSWTGHDNIEIITNENKTFDEKIHDVIKVIYKELGVPHPIRKQQKYLVESIDIEKISQCLPVKLELEQFFTESTCDSDTMVRKTTKDGDSTYSSTTKRDTKNANERITTSRRITDKDYNDLLNQTPDKPIKKVRYCFTYNKQYYRLDIFEQPEGLMILETGLTNLDKKTIIPEFIKVSKEITADKDYRNSSIYKKINNRCKNSPLVKKVN